jgi:hypothetical protein
MSKAPSHQLHKGSWVQAEKAGKALAKWLNTPASGHKFKWQVDSGHTLVQELVIDAQVVFLHLKKYDSVDQFHVARRKKELPHQFSKSYVRLNDRLGEHTLAPRIDADAVLNAKLVIWVMTDDSGVAHVRAQVGQLLQVIDAGAIQKLRRCQQCKNWFFTRFSHQTFCKRSCQAKKFSESDDFKAKKRKYMRKYREEMR